MVNTITYFFHLIIGSACCFCLSIFCGIKNERDRVFIGICYRCCTSCQLFICFDSKCILCNFIPIRFHVCTAADLILEFYFIRVSCRSADLSIWSDLYIFIYYCRVIEIDFLCCFFCISCCPVTDPFKAFFCQGNSNCLATYIFRFCSGIIFDFCSIILYLIGVLQ